MRLRARVWLILAAALASAPVLAIGRIEISAGSMSGPGWRVESPKAVLEITQGMRVEVTARRATVRDRSLEALALRCAALRLAGAKCSCAEGELAAGALKRPITFSADAGAARAEVVSLSGAGERWAIKGGRGVDMAGTADGWRIEAALANVPLAQFAHLAPDGQPKPTAGRVDGIVVATTSGTAPAQLSVNLKLADAAFSDTTGLKAGEKLDAELVAKIEGEATGPGWRWRMALNYVNGEVFWSPVYIAKGGHALNASGRFESATFRVERATLKHAEIGTLSVAGDASFAPFALRTAEVEARGLALAPLFETFIKPYFDQSALGESVARGTLNVAGTWREGRPQSAKLELAAAGLTDPRGRFGLSGLVLSLPWERGIPLRGRVDFESASLLNVPVGKVGFNVNLEGARVNVRRLFVPVLDGRLEVRNFDFEHVGEGAEAGWTWRLDGRIQPISMEALTTALKLPVMKGSLSGEIPNVVFARNILAVNGEIDVKVFDGTLQGRDIALLEPLGRAPRFLGDFSATNLDLGLMTSTFSFGRIEGRIDARVNRLELANWKPVKFDAEMRSSAGEYRKRISQQAVQNISSIGGAGAAAAIQRSLLRFFEEFGYDRLGMTCKLANGVCAMGGVADAPQGFVLVQGGGIPAITVMGYNRNVGWETFVSRLQGVIEGNIRPTIQ